MLKRLSYITIIIVSSGSRVALSMFKYCSLVEKDL